MNKLEFYGFNDADIYQISKDLPYSPSPVLRLYACPSETGCTVFRGSSNDISDETGLDFSEDLSDPENSFSPTDFRGLDLRILYIDDEYYLEDKNYPIEVTVEFIDHEVTLKNTCTLRFYNAEDLKFIKIITY